MKDKYYNDYYHFGKTVGESKSSDKTSDEEYVKVISANYHSVGLEPINMFYEVDKESDLEEDTKE